jgi:hypothetical protein
VDLSGCTGTFTVHWFDPRNGGALQTTATTAVAGGGSRALGNPPGGATTDDWAILVRRLYTFDIALASGYNLVALPLRPEAPLTAEGLAEAVNADDGSCVSVIRYADGAFETHPVGTAVENFPVTVGAGYFLRCTNPSTWTVEGYPLRADRASMALSTGYNLVGLPLETARYYAETASGEINGQGGAATQVIQYDAGAFVTHPAGTAVDNFPLGRGRGYFIRCLAPSFWNVTK